jgi:hypothetical protein
MADVEQPPVLAQEDSNPTTTLAIVAEEKQPTTIVLEHQRIALQSLIERQALHDPSTKSYKALGERVAKLKQRYDNETSAFQAKQLLLPTRRAAASTKRAATLKAKHEALITDVVKRVTDALGADAASKKRAAAAVADLFGDGAAPEPAKKAKTKKARVEAEEESD